MEEQLRSVIMAVISITTIFLVVGFATGVFGFKKLKIEENKEEKKNDDSLCKVIEFPKKTETEKVKTLKKKYIMDLIIDTKIPGLTYGLASAREDEPYKKPIENIKIKNFISWYNNGKTPVFYFHYSNGDLSCVHRDSIVGFRITKRIEVIDS